jgi:polar amino acid transport system substrate-binding protein
MRNGRTRRPVVSGILAAPLAANAHKVWAQAAAPGQGLLARLRAAKKVVVGVAPFPPYSGIDPDGTLTGLAPTLSKAIMERLGVPEMSGVAVAYGELIPGMQARRWDFISASLSITKLRCDQVLFSDPIVYDGGSFVSLKGALANPPKLVADLVAQKLVVGVGAGGAIARLALDRGVDPSNLRQYPDNLAIVDALIAKRIQVAFQNNASISPVWKQRKLNVDVTFPIEDDPTSGSGCAFRLTDADLHEAYQKELRAMKGSGQYLEIARQFGFDTPANLIPITIDQACKTAP